jgi:hypothetical protein
MEVKSLIGTLKGITTSEKTASEKNPEQPPAEKTATDATVDARMREVIASATQEKRAASGESLQVLLSKEAQALSDANDEAIVRRSKLAGTAFGEAAVAVFDRAGQAADAVVKEASANLDPDFVELVKLAQHDPGRFLAEVRAGYEAHTSKSQKQAEYNAAVHGWATDHYLAGYESVRRALGA